MKRLPLKEVVRRCAKMPPKYAAFAAIGVSTGSRVSEITPLRRRDLIDESGGFRDLISFVLLKSRTDDKRVMTLPPYYRRYVIQYLDLTAAQGYFRPDDWVFPGYARQPLSRFTVYAFFYRFLGPGYGTHWMRKTFAWEVYQYFLRQSGDMLRALEFTRQALKHQRLETTIKYLGLDELRIYEAQNEIFKEE